MSHKNKVVGIRLDEDEYSLLKKQAEADRRKLSDFMRCQLLKDKNISGWNKK